MHDIVGSFHLIGLSTDEIDIEKDKIIFRFGIYNEKTFIDWLIIGVGFNTTNDPPTPIWECLDGYSKINRTNEVSEDAMNNCFLNSTRSKLEIKDKKISIEAAFIRPFKTMDVWSEDEDLQLSLDSLYGIQLRVQVPNKVTFATYHTVDVS